MLFIFIPLIIFAQFDPSADDYIFSDELPESLTDKMLESAAGKVFSDSLKLRIAIFGQHKIYDMCGYEII